MIQQHSSNQNQICLMNMGGYTFFVSIVCSDVPFSVFIVLYLILLQDYLVLDKCSSSGWYRYYGRVRVSVRVRVTRR